MKPEKRARRKQHQLFWKTHMLYPLFYLLIILHGIEGILQQPRFHLYLIVPGKLKIIQTHEWRRWMKLMTNLRIFVDTKIGQRILLKHLPYLGTYVLIVYMIVNLQRDYFCD